MTGELRALTSMRGIAAWMVVLFHIRASIHDLPEWAQTLFAHGYLAVDFFFLLSGFVIWISYGERLRAGGLGGVPDFLKRRIARIWPLHLFMLGFGVALALAMLATGRQSDHFPFAELPWHVLLVQNWGLTDALSWNDPAWSISCEFGAYLLFPLLALTVDWRRVPSWALVASLAALVILLHAIFSAQGATSLGEKIPRLGLIRCLLEFAAGIAVGALWARWRADWQFAACGALLFALVLAIGWYLGLPQTLAAPAVFTSLLLALALTSGRSRNPLDGTALHYLGEISYATYLCHYLLWFAFKLAIVSDPHAVAWPLIGFYLALVLAASIALYHLVERPAQRWVNGLPLPGSHALERSPAGTNR